MVVSPSTNGGFTGFKWDFKWVLNGDYIVSKGTFIVTNSDE